LLCYGKSSTNWDQANWQEINLQNRFNLKRGENFGRFFELKIRFVYLLFYSVLGTYRGNFNVDDKIMLLNESQF